MKKILFGIIGLVSLIAILTVGNPDFVSSIKQASEKTPVEAVVETENTDIIDADIDLSADFDSEDSEEVKEATSIIKTIVAESQKTSEPKNSKSPVINIYSNNSEPVSGTNGSAYSQPANILVITGEGSNGNIYAGSAKSEEEVEEEKFEHELIMYLIDKMNTQTVVERVVEVEKQPEVQVVERIVEKIVEVPVEVPAEEPVEEPVEEPAEDDFFKSSEDFETVEIVAEPLEKIVEKVVEKVVEVPAKAWSDKGFFFQSGLSAGAGYHRYSEDHSVMFDTAIDLRAGVFFNDRFGIYGYVNPTFVGQIVNVSRSISLPNSLNLSAGFGCTLNFGKFGVSVQGGASVLNIGFTKIKPYFLANASVIPELTIARNGKLSVKAIMPVTGNASLDENNEIHYLVYGGFGLSVKIGGSAK